MRFHHVQLSCPPGGEDEGRRFFVDGLGFSEVPKPSELAKRGGAWFRHAGGAEIHLGVDEPAQGKKAHPGLELESTAALERLATHLESLGYDVDWSQRYNAESFERFYTHDPFGNRLEILHVLKTD